MMEFIDHGTASGMRETIESFFESMKQRGDGARVRVWDTDTLRVRMFVQFFALCYYEYQSNEIRNMKKLLGVKNGDPAHDAAENLALERKLKSWLENSPIYLVFQWFNTLMTLKCHLSYFKKMDDGNDGAR
jgi:hypothetical protein